MGIEELLKSAPAFMIFVGALVYVLKELLPYLKPKAEREHPERRAPVTCEAERLIGPHSREEMKVLADIGETLHGAAAVNRDTSIMIREHIVDTRNWRDKTDAKIDRVALESALALESRRNGRP